eukprot:3918168-Prymnesium_polylepis.1
MGHKQHTCKHPDRGQPAKASAMICVTMNACTYPPQFLWSMYQAKVKKEVDACLRTAHGQPAHRTDGHAGSARAASCTARGERRRQPGSHTARELQRPRAKDAEGQQEITMCVEYGPPEFFLTLYTTNEMGWTGRAACGAK